MSDKFESNRAMDDANNNFCLKIFKTICLALAFMTLGMCTSIIGPTLPTLAYNLQIPISTLAFTVFARGAGYLLGSVVSGFIYEKSNRDLLIFFALCVTAIGTIVIPYFQYFVWTAVAISTARVSMGFLDTAGNVNILQIWGVKAGPFLQSLHFSFAVGTTIAPLLAIPFIMEVRHESEQNVSSADKTQPSVTTDLLDVVTTANSTDTFVKFYSVSYIFIICAGITFLVGLLFLYLAVCHNAVVTSDQHNTVKEEGSIFRIKMLGLLFLFFLVYVGIEVGFGVYIYTFAIKSDKMYSKAQASILNSLFWGAFAVGRFFAIPISKYFSPSKVLRVSLLGTFSSAVIFCCFPLYADNADFLLWIAVAVYGLSMASIFPTGISWAEQYITVTGKAAMILVVGGATGEMICPILIGQFVEDHPIYLMYFALGSACISIIIYVLLSCLGRSRGKRLRAVIKVEQDNKAMEELKTLND